MIDLIQRRRNMMLRGGGGVDWEGILMALIDGSLAELDIPSGITETRSCIFRDAESIIRLTVPEGVTKINASFCYNASNLESVTLPSTLTGSLGNYSFTSCAKLKNITIPSGITSLGQQSFQGCTAMEYMILQSTTPPTIYGNTFKDNTCLFYVPDSAVNRYKGASTWSDLSSRIYSINDFPTP